jgi:hypothetical protein
MSGTAQKGRFSVAANETAVSPGDGHDRLLLDEAARILVEALLMGLLTPPFYPSASPRQRATFILHPQAQLSLRRKDALILVMAILGIAIRLAIQANFTENAWRE